MTKPSLKLFSLLAASALLGVGSLQAQDKATLDLLVKKGLVTQDEADKLLNTETNKAIAVTQKATLAQSITVGGYVQVGYDSVNLNRRGAADPANHNGFSLTKAVLLISADFGNGWGAAINPEFDSSRAGGNYLDSAWVSYTFEDYGTLSAGFNFVTFAEEEYIDPTTAKTINTSAATNYFVGGNAFASRHVGVFWNGTVKGVDGLFYGAAVTNSLQDQAALDSFNNKPAFWANAGYTFTGKSSEGTDTWTITLGANLGWQRDSTTPTLNAEVFGFNPYIKATAGGFAFTGEVLGGYVSRDGASHIVPVGFNATASFLVNDWLEPVVRLSWIDTDGSDGIATSMLSNTPDVGDTFDSAWGIYAGLNITLSSATGIQLGYEFTRYDDGTVVSKADGHALRALFQAVF